MTREFIDFVLTHENEDTARLLLSASRYPSIDMAAAVQHIEGLRTAREKWPGLLGCRDFVYPPRLNREQASSEATAEYKRQWAVGHVADLTGGMGIDSLAFATVAEHVDYVEHDNLLCSLMEHNKSALGLANVDVHHANSIDWLSALPEGRFNLLFVDPARRNSRGRKVSAFEDCEPNILAHAALLRSHCSRMLIKASPMIDIDLACRQLGDVTEVHIVAVKGECKEVLFVCGEPSGEPRIVCINLSSPETFSFTRSEEASAEARYCQSVDRYLYEPDATLMKGGPFKLISQRLGLEMLGHNTHLYTANRRINNFPGRTFEVLRELKLNHKEASAVIHDRKAHVVTRNFPIEAAALQRQLGLREGGDLFVIATCIGSRKSGFLCKI